MKHRSGALASAGLIVSVLALAACAQGQRSVTQEGSRHRHEFKHNPFEAARCFGRNAEDHSSALVAEVNRTRDGAQAIVRVKNGVLYATADLRPAGSGSTGTVTLMSRSSGRRSDLLERLVEGC